MLRLIQTEEFKTLISSCSTNAEDDAISLFRILRYTRFRLQTLQAVYLMDGKGKKCVGATMCH